MSVCLSVCGGLNSKLFIVKKPVFNKFIVKKMLSVGKGWGASPESPVFVCLSCGSLKSKLFIVKKMLSINYKTCS